MGIYTYWLGINEYADMTHAEFTLSKSGVLPQNTTYENSVKAINLNLSDFPNEVDWRKEGYVTEVKNQENCGGCWAFSATGALEGQHFKNTGKLLSLSEQELIDCCRKDHGCDGGLMENAFACIRDLGGIELEKNYKFEGNDGKCRFNANNVVAKVSNYTTIKSLCEECLQYAVATVGPISAAIFSKESTFHLYKRGVYKSGMCEDTVNHGVLVVGYGTENGQEYWLVKNSWGPTWGLNGYIKIARNSRNMCGIATLTSFPNE